MPHASIEYQQVCIESLGVTLPGERVTSAEIEQRLEPVYRRLKLPEGRLELMTGITERRFWPQGTRPSQMSILSGRRAIEVAGVDREQIGCLIHGSVCRDYLEPATASTVHQGIGLSPHCLIYDVSNACLGLLNGVIQAANMIELNQIQAAVVVGSEGGRPLVENTIDYLNREPSLTRHTIKPAFASLTIGSASCAILLTHRSISRTGNRLLAATALANTRFHDLCRSDQDQAGAEMQPLMDTDSEELLKQGVATGVEAFDLFLDTTGWQREQIELTVCHQVGAAHRKAMLEALQLDARRDFVTYPWLGNTGSVALPVTWAAAAEQDRIPPGSRLALLGIGSGINCVFLAVEWHQSSCAALADTD